ncbi:TIGR01841 family phasin [Sphingomonas sp. RP10(2022)]|uniref:TIGR01841 family phasin n=1 Tax=Sphingomonas liriopis TaxID=2949094 RepID=A0A9X2HV37_9SPHN|nr:TIGR01841 family phasin [Sphingomonas liriopis]MCP3736079.1 TIGR01841 family phasin [Sphingomonas liriopis]
MLDDTVAKPPVKPVKGGRPVRDVAAAPQLPGTKPTGRKPAPAVRPAPVVQAALPAAPAPVAPPAPVVAAPEPAPVPDPIVAAPLADTPAPITPIAAKETIMETIENVTAKAQTAFADATNQAKGAVAKSQKVFEDANEFGKGNIEALVESSKIAARGLEALGQEAAAYAKKSFEEATVAAKTMTSVKSPTEFLKFQSDYVRSAFDALVQQSSRNTETLLKLAGEVAQPLSNRVALAAEKLKVAA